MTTIRAAALLAMAIVLAGCAGAVPAPSGSAAATASPPGDGPSPPVVSPTPTGAGPDGSPPDALLRVEGADPVAGQLGSYTFAGGGSDSPWLPGSPVTAAAGEPVTVGLADGSAVAGWAARRAPAGATSGTGATAIGDGEAAVAFSAPGPGSWTVEVTIRFATGGSATYYWRLDVT